MRPHLRRNVFRVYGRLFWRCANRTRRSVCRLAFVIRPLFPVLLSPHFPRLLILSGLQFNYRGEAGKGVVASINRRHKGISRIRQFFFLFSNRSLCVRNNQDSMKFIEFYGISNVSSALLKNGLFAANSPIILSIVKNYFFRSIIFPILTWSWSRWNSTVTGFRIYQPRNFFNSIHLCILWS